MADENEEKNEDLQGTAPADAAEEKNEQKADVENTEVSEVDQLKAALAEQQAKYLYLQAEYQNYRKRAARDVSDARVRAVSDTLVPFLAVVDFLNMAESAAEKSDNIDAIRQGLKMIIGEFEKALDELSVKRMHSVGEKFDPELHDAVGNEASESVPEGYIIREWSAGFKIGEKLLRPARVLVSSGKAADESTESEA